MPNELRFDDKIIANRQGRRSSTANTTRLIFMPEPYPCYPFNPWFFSDFQKIGVSFAAKE